MKKGMKLMAGVLAAASVFAFGFAARLAKKKKRKTCWWWATPITSR